MIDKESLIQSLHDLGAVQFGDFELSPGSKAPVYLDMRLLVSRPGTLRRVAHMMRSVSASFKYDRLAALPYAGLPIGVALSLEVDKPLIYPREQTKQHGTGRYIEGKYNPGETILIVDDVISHGQSKHETLDLLEALRLKIADILVVVDYGLGASDALRARGYKVHALLTLREVLDTLLRLKQISEEQYGLALTWIDEVQKTAS